MGAMMQQLLTPPPDGVPKMAWLQHCGANKETPRYLS